MATSLSSRSNPTAPTSTSSKHSTTTTTTTSDWQSFSVPRRRPSYDGQAPRFTTEGGSNQSVAAPVVNVQQRNSNASTIVDTGSKGLPRFKRPRSLEEDPPQRQRQEKPSVRESTGEHDRRSSGSSNGRDGEYKSSSISTASIPVSSLQQPTKSHPPNNTTTTPSTPTIRSSTTTTIKSSSSERRDSTDGVSSTSHKASSSKEARRSSVNSTPGNSESKAERRSSVGSVKSTSSSGSSGFRRLKKFSSPSDKKKRSKSVEPSSSKKHSGSPTISASPSKTDDDLSVSDSFQAVQLRLWKAAQEQNKVMQQLQVDKRMKKLKKAKEEERRGSISSKEGEAAEADAEALRAKKQLKKWKKQQRLAAAVEAEEETSTTVATDEAPKKKKKRRLTKLGSQDEEDEPPKKKKKKVVKDEEDMEYQPKPTAMKAPSTPEPTKTVNSFAMDPLPASTLSFGLADTVKTRVRSCNKEKKDELELLQAASFEKKKRRKNKQKQVAMEDKVAKKKKKEKQPLFVDSQLSGSLSIAGHMEATVKVKRGRGRPPKKKKPIVVMEEEVMYDADVEAPKAPSEVSSNSETVVTGKIKKKKKRKKFKAELSSMEETSSGATSFDVADHRRERDHHMPFKKRMAAAAAADSSFWERPNTSTTASKVSVSSAGTGPGATPEFNGTEASSISEFTHPMEAASAHLPPSATNTAHAYLPQKPSPVPREILSKTAPSHLAPSSFDFSVNAHTSVIGPTISSSDDSDSDSSDTDEEELYSWANKMFGTAAKPEPKTEQQKPVFAQVNETILSPEQCEMERRRQKQEESRTLSIKEVNAIMQEELSNPAPAAGHWVRRSVRLPSRGILNSPLVRRLLDKLRGNDTDMVVLKMKKYLSDPDTPSMLIDAALDALEDCTNCEALYIQNFNIGMKDKQVLHLLRILQMPSCNIWCLNIGETYNVTDETWEIFADGLKKTKVTHMYASEHTITTELKDEIRETIRLNRSKHNMHNDPKNLDVIVQCTHCWWNPINAKILRPYIRKRGFESLLNDREAQGLRGSMSEAPVE